MVGPLPVSSNTTIQKLDYIFNGGKGGKIPFNARFFDRARDVASEPLLASVMTEVADITGKLFGGVYYGAMDNRTDLTYTFDTPVSRDGTQATRIVIFRYPTETEFLQPIDFYLLLDIPGTDPSKYSLRGIVTNEKFFPTVATFRAAYDAGQIINEFPQVRDNEWARLTPNKTAPTREFEDRLAPQSIELGGKRYKLDVEQQYVEYMGWSFYMSWTRTLGLAFYNINYKGERILYELSMQEAAAQYAGNTPKAASTVYHDTHYGFGTMSAVLLEGFDCPFGASLLNISYPDGRGTTVKPQAICIFEADSGYPLARHRTTSFGPFFGYGFSNLGVVKASALHVRHIATVGNYDYLFDFAFYVDGSIEVGVRASGYLQASPYYKTQDRFGPRVQKRTYPCTVGNVPVYCSPTKTAIHNPNPRTPPPLSQCPRISGSCQNARPHENFPPPHPQIINPAESLHHQHHRQQPSLCSHATTQQPIAAVSRKQSQSIALLILHRNEPLRRRIQRLGWLERRAERRLRLRMIAIAMPSVWHQPKHSARALIVGGNRARPGAGDSFGRYDSTLTPPEAAEGPV